MQFPVLWFGLALAALHCCDEKQRMLKWNKICNSPQLQSQLLRLFSSCSWSSCVEWNDVYKEQKKKATIQNPNSFCGWTCLCCKSPHTVVQAHCHCCYFYRCGLFSLVGVVQPQKPDWNWNWQNEDCSVCWRQVAALILTWAAGSCSCFWLQNTVRFEFLPLSATLDKRVQVILLYLHLL